MTTSKRILNEFQKAIKFYSRSQVVDLDINFNEKFEFHALRLEDVFRVSKNVPPNRWSFHRIGIITEGTGEFLTGMYKFPAKKNTLVVVPARMITSSQKWSDDVKGLIVLFNSKFLRKNILYKSQANSKLLDLLVEPYLYLNEEQGREITFIFESILREQSENKTHRDELLPLKLVELMIKCERLFEDCNNLGKGLSNHQIVGRFNRLIDKHFHEQHSVAFYASKLNLHPNYLNALIKKYTNETAKDSISNRLLIEIKYLLHSTSLSVKEISNRVGFEDPNYMASFFKRLENVSPMQYRIMVSHFRK